MTQKYILAATLLIGSMALNIAYAESPFAELKQKVQGGASNTILKAAGVLHCPKGQQCYCSNPNKSNNFKVKCNYIDKNKVTQKIEQKYSDVRQCVTQCLGKTMETLSKDDVRGQADTPPTATSAPTAPRVCKSWLTINGQKTCQAYK